MMRMMMCRQYDRPGGAMTTSLVTALAAQPYGQTLPDLMKAMDRNLKARGFPQKPQLSSTQQFEVSQRIFAIDDICPNMNQFVGRTPLPPGTKRKRPKPKKTALHGTPLGGMLNIAIPTIAAIGALAIAGNILGSLFD
eukprot:GHVR01116401.1.p1 GENE.GHVR01116401.1~~GHVR01116401.1.p1  ORF type:complete len:138 (+),score=24.29 GHVR01116401.1:314-727(+)